MTLRIGINGLGRIGRSVLRAFVEQNFATDMTIVAVNGPAATEEHAHLLRYDSVHGPCTVPVTAENDRLRLGNVVDAVVYHERDPSLIPWHKHDVDVVLECSGKFNKRELAAAHLQNGVKKVIVSAPCEEADATLVYGVNHQDLSSAHQVISVGSCTTNCLAPVAKTLHQKVGIESGFMTTIHAYTNDQSILDGSHKDRRRARACALSMVPTSTGAAKAIGLVIPELAGKLKGSAIRVPTPNVSMIDLTCYLASAVDKEELNHYFTEACHTHLKGVMAITTEALVSIDFNHNPHSAIIDALETFVVDKKLARIVAWYDNEWAFSLRMLDMTRLVKGVLRG